MSRETLERVLELVCRELGATDARLELGGRPAHDARHLHVELPGGFRLVAVFDEPPDEPKAVQRRLETMGSSFFDLGVRPPSVRPDADYAGAQRRLDDELSALCGRTGASSALVIDVTSPIVWGSSEARGEHSDVDVLLELAALSRDLEARGVDLLALLEQSDARAQETKRAANLSSQLSRRAGRAHERLGALSSRARRTQLIEARTLAELRADSAETEGSPTYRRIVRREDSGYFARSFAGIYVLVLCFEGEFSELHVEGAALHALPIIERYVMMLPPVEPPPKGGRVLRLSRPEQR